MKIAYINADFGIPVWGHQGASIHLREMVAAMCREGHAVWLMHPAAETKDQEKTGSMGNKKADSWSTTPQPSRSSAANDLDEVIFVPVVLPKHHQQIFQELETLDKFWAIKTHLSQELHRLLYNLTLYEKALTYLQSCRVDCIYERYSLFSYAGIRLAKALGVPHLLEVNAPLAYAPEINEFGNKTLCHETERRIFLETNQVVVVSRQLRDFIISSGVPMGHFTILPNAVNIQRFDPQLENNNKAVREQFQFNSKSVIGFVGSLQPWQGVETLIAAFCRLQTVAPHTHLLIVGDGPDREKLERQAEASGLRNSITFTGRVPYDEVPHYIAAMDITVAPYKNENFYYSPMPIFEYMAMGKPIVANSIGQVQEMITDGKNGLLYAAGNFAQLTAALTKLTSSALLRRHLGGTARAWVQKEHTWENNVQQIIKVANELIRKRKNVAN